MIQITPMKEASFWEILILATKHVVTFSVIKVRRLIVHFDFENV